MNTFEVIVPCYRYGPFLRECVESILAQSIESLSVVIVNDASPDDTGAVADALSAQDRRVSIITHETNRGHIASYNEALERTVSQYCLILSADDLLTPGALGRAAAALDRHPAAGLCYGDDVPFTNGDERPPLRSVPMRAQATLEDYQSFLRGSCSLGHTPIQAPTAVMRTSVQRSVGGFLPELPHSGDTEIWLRLATAGGVVTVHADQAYRRLHQSNMSHDYSLVSRLREQQRAFETHFDWVDSGLPPDEAAACKKQLGVQLGMSSFWIAARAFDERKADLVHEALEYAVEVYPSIRREPAFRHMRLKQAMGMRVWSAVLPFFRRKRAATVAAFR